MKLGSNPPEVHRMRKKYLVGRNMYERWLLESVLIRGWTTLKCAQTMKSDKWPCGAKPETVLKEFNDLVEGN